MTPTSSGPAQPLCGGLLCPFKTPAVNLTPAGQSKTGLPGQMLGYPLTLANEGTLADSIGLSINFEGFRNAADQVAPLDFHGIHLAVLSR